MIQYCCDVCNKVVTDHDPYVYLDMGGESMIICSKSCGYKWIDEMFEEVL